MWNATWVAKRRARGEFERRGKETRKARKRPDLLELSLNVGSVIAGVLALYYWGVFAPLGFAP